MALALAGAASAAARRLRNRWPTSPATWRTRSPSTGCTPTCASLPRSPTRNNGSTGRGHSRVRRQRRLRRANAAGQGFRRRDPRVRAARRGVAGASRRWRSSGRSLSRRPGLAADRHQGGRAARDDVATAEARGLRGRRLRDEEVRPAPSPSSTTPAARSSTSRTPPSKRAPSAFSSSAIPATTAARGACSRPGTTAAQGSRRGHRSWRRRRSCAAPVHRWC